MRQLSILNSEFRIVKFRIQLSNFKIIHRNRVQKYNYFLNNQPFYEKKFVFLIISLKINNTINAVLRRCASAKQHSLYRIIRNSTEKLRHIYCAGMAQARPREWILGRSLYAILWKTLTTSSSASRRSMRPLTSSCSSGESSRIVMGMRSNLNDLIS